MSGAGNAASGATIFSENTTSGGPNDVTVANLRVQQDMRVDGNFEVGTFSIDDLTVNDDLNITDQLTVGGNTYAQYLETALDVNCKGDLLVEQTIVCDGLASLNGGADMPPTKRLRVGTTTVNAEVNETDVTVTNLSGEGSLFHNRIHISDATNTHIARVRLNGTTMEVGPSTSSTLALQTAGTTRATVDASTGQVAITNGIASSSATTGALVITGGLGVAGQIWGSARIQTSGPIATTSSTASNNSSTGAVTITGGLGVGNNINAAGYISATTNLSAGGTLSVTGISTFGNEVRNVERELFSNSLLSATPDYVLPNNFRELIIVIRAMSVGTAAAQIRLAFKSSTTAVTHAGATGTTAWNAGYIIIAAPASAADNINTTIRVINTGPASFNSTYSYVVSGTTQTAAASTSVLSGDLNIASTTGAIDNMSFTVSAGVFDAGRVSIYATYCT